MSEGGKKIRNDRVDAEVRARGVATAVALAKAGEVEGNKRLVGVETQGGGETVYPVRGEGRTANCGKRAITRLFEPPYTVRPSARRSRGCTRERDGRTAGSTRARC